MTTDTVKVEIVRDEEGVKIAQYNRTMAALAELEKKHKGVVFDVTTTAGMKEAKAARKELRDLRVDLEKKRKALKAPVLDYTRALDGQAKDITATLYCSTCMAPIRHRLTPGAARELRDELIEAGHLCRRQHALPAPVPAGIDTTHDIEAETAGRKG